MLAITAIVILFAVAVILLVLILLEAKRMSQHEHHEHEHHHHGCDCNICKELSQIKHEVRENRAILRRIAAAVAELPLPTDMTISQIGDSSMTGKKLTNNSIVAGTSGTFQETNIPAG